MNKEERIKDLTNSIEKKLIWIFGFYPKKIHLVISTISLYLNTGRFPKYYTKNLVDQYDQHLQILLKTIRCLIDLDEINKVQIIIEKVIIKKYT